MGNGTADRVTLSQAAQCVLRILIASYFLAVAVHIIPGTDLSLLFAGVLPPPYGEAAATGLVFLLAFMVMVASHTRVAALILALMTFYASYLAMVELGVAEELGSFWRDLALIAALLLTYSDAAPSATVRRRSFRRHVAPRRIAPILERVAAARAEPKPVAPFPRRVSRPRATPEPEPEIDNLFADIVGPETEGGRHA